jgi:hypothetical protein
MQTLDVNIGIDFGERGNLTEFSPVGFSATPDKVSTWTERPFAELSFQLPPLRRDLRLGIQAFPYLAEEFGIRKQDCWIFFNGLLAHFFTARQPVEISFSVPREYSNPRANRLSFVLPDAVSPKDINRGNDLRILGLAFVKLSVARG